MAKLSMKLITVIMVSFGWLTSCTSSGKKEIDEEVEITDDDTGVAPLPKDNDEDDGDDDDSVADESDTEDDDADLKPAESKPMEDESSIIEPDVPIETAPAPTVVPAAPVVAPRESMASGDATVRYVKSASARVFSAADAKSKVVKQLSKGEPVLVTDEGAWARLGDGTYIQKSDLSVRPVARTKGKSEWRKP